MPSTTGNKTKFMLLFHDIYLNLKYFVSVKIKSNFHTFVDN